MKALIIIDMQEDYIGQNRNQKRYPYISEQLVNNINLRIADYKRNNDLIIYVKNKGKSSIASPFVPGMQFVSDLVFEKSKASCFSNMSLLSCIKDKAVNQIELAGVDGNYCVGMSALDGAKLGFSICFNLSCIGIANTERFESTKKRLVKANISFL